MAYTLGVDLGTSYTAAAISRDGVLEMVSLGTRSLEIPSVVYLDPNGSLIVGEAAERRGASDPVRLAREFKRRLGDPAPILVGGTPFSAESLMAAVLRSVIADVTARQGEPPAHVTLTRPANWGPYKQELFGHVPALSDLGPSTTATEPEAAAVHFASTTRVAPGQVVAVYDLGGGTFDAAVLRKTDDGFTTLGTPEGVEHLGGADFDDAVFEYVRRVLGPAFAQLDPTDPAVRTAAARLRTECVLAKESLSRDTEATIPVMLPGLQTEVRLTRQEFEDLVRPSLMTTIESLRRAVRSSRISPDDILATVLAGGSSRIPLAAELITGELQLPVAVGTHPKHTVALGAALLAARDVSRPVSEDTTGRITPGMLAAASQPPAGPRSGPIPSSAPPPPPPPPPYSPMPVDPATVSVGQDSHPSDPSATSSGLFGLPNQFGVLEKQDGRRKRSSLIVALIAALAVALVVVLVIVRPWNKTANGTALVAGSSSATAPSNSTVESTSGPSESSVASSSDPTVSSSDPTVSSSDPTSSSESPTPTSATAAVVPPGRLIPTGATCDPTSLAFLGTLKDPSVEDKEGTGDTERFGLLAIGMKNAVDLAIKQFNEANPDCRVSLKVFNTNFVPDTAEVESKRIAADGTIVGVVGGIFAADVGRAGPALHAAGLPFIVTPSTTLKLNGKDWTGYARVIGPSGNLAIAGIKYLDSLPDITKVAVVDDGSNYGKGMNKPVGEALGDRVVATVQVDPASDLASAVSEIRDSEAQFVYFSGAPTLAGTLISALRSAGYDGKFMFNEIDSNPRAVLTAGADANGALFACTCAPQDADPEFTEAYRKTFDEAPTSFAAESYDAAVILLRGIKEGNVTREGLATFVRGYTSGPGDSVTKPEGIAFDDTGELTGNPAWIMEIKDGIGATVVFEP